MGRKHKGWAELAAEAAAADDAYKKAIDAAARTRTGLKEQYSKRREHLLITLGGMVLKKAGEDAKFRERLIKLATEEEARAKGKKAKADRVDLQAMIAAAASLPEPEEITAAASLPEPENPGETDATDADAKQ